MKRKSIFRISIVTALCLQALAAPRPHYQISRAGNYPNAVSTFPMGVSSSQIVGYYTPVGNGMGPAGYVQTGNAFVTAQPAGATFSYLFAVNTSGLAAGEYCDVCAGVPTWSVHAYTYDSNTASTATIDFPGARTTAAYGINDNGNVVGGFCLATEICSSGLVMSSRHAFIENNGVFTQLDFPGSTQTTAFGVNSSDTVVGVYAGGAKQHSFVYQDGVFSTLDFPGAESTTATAINNSGVIVGWYSDPQFVTFGFIYHRGQFIKVSSPSQYNMLHGIDGENDLVGTWYSPTRPVGLKAILKK